MEFQAFLIQRTKIDFYNHMPLMSDFQTGVPLFIHQMSKNYKIPVILLALESKFPDETNLKKLIFEIGASYHTYENEPSKIIENANALQSLLNNEIWFDTDVFFNLLGARKRCVCRVEVNHPNGNTSTGTGFLISPNQVMTNYHVVQKVLDEPDYLKKVVCRFDFETQTDSTELSSGTVFEVDAQQPIELYSEYCDYDVKGEANLQLECAADKLDFAIINLAQAAGNLPFGVHSETSNTGVARGWIPLKTMANDVVAENNTLIILQHPAKSALKMAIGLNKLIGVSPQKRRVRYEINTLNGSSGSPVFNTNFEVVALHNMGDPSYIPTFNQGVVMNRIIEFLNKKNYTIPL
jgi:V8-like Glu-specific endopeptidase